MDPAASYDNLIFLLFEYFVTHINIKKLYQTPLERLSNGYQTRQLAANGVLTPIKHRKIKIKINNLQQSDIERLSNASSTPIERHSNAIVLYLLNYI